MVVVKLLLGEFTNRSRGSQKSELLSSEATEWGMGDGEGESDGQVELKDRRSEC